MGFIYELKVLTKQRLTSEQQEILAAYSNCSFSCVSGLLTYPADFVLTKPQQQHEPSP